VRGQTTVQEHRYPCYGFAYTNRGALADHVNRALNGVSPAAKAALQEDRPPRQDLEHSNYTNRGALADRVNRALNGVSPAAKAALQEDRPPRQDIDHSSSKSL